MALLCYLLSVVVLLLFSTLSSCERIEWKLNFGGEPTAGFSPEGVFVKLADTIPKMRFHGNMKGSGKDLAVFKTQRFAREEDLVFTIPVPDGVYDVTLMFAETWKGAYEVGKRVFDVYLGSKPGGIVRVIDQLDAFAKVGAEKPLRRTFHAIATQGGLALALRPIRQNAQIAGMIIDGFSYSPSLMQEIPFVEAELGETPDFGPLYGIERQPQSDPDLLYNPLQNPKLLGGMKAAAAIAKSQGSIGSGTLDRNVNSQPSVSSHFEHNMAPVSRYGAPSAGNLPAFQRFQNGASGGGASMLHYNYMGVSTSGPESAIQTDNSPHFRRKLASHDDGSRDGTQIQNLSPGQPNAWGSQQQLHVQDPGIPNDLPSSEPPSPYGASGTQWQPQEDQRAQADSSNMHLTQDFDQTSLQATTHGLADTRAPDGGGDINYNAMQPAFQAQSGVVNDNLAPITTHDVSARNDQTEYNPATQGGNIHDTSPLRQSSAAAPSDFGQKAIGPGISYKRSDGDESSSFDSTKVPGSVIGDSQSHSFSAPGSAAHDGTSPHFGRTNVYQGPEGGSAMASSRGRSDILPQEGEGPTHRFTAPNVPVEDGDAVINKDVAGTSGFHVANGITQAKSTARIPGWDNGPVPYNAPKEDIGRLEANVPDPNASQFMATTQNAPQIHYSGTDESSSSGSSIGQGHEIGLTEQMHGYDDRPFRGATPPHPGLRQAATQFQPAGQFHGQVSSHYTELPHSTLDASSNREDGTLPPQEDHGASGNSPFGAHEVPASNNPPSNSNGMLLQDTSTSLRKHTTESPMTHADAPSRQPVDVHSQFSGGAGIQGQDEGTSTGPPFTSPPWQPDGPTPNHITPSDPQLGMPGTPPSHMTMLPAPAALETSAERLENPSLRMASTKDEPLMYGAFSTRAGTVEAGTIAHATSRTATTMHTASTQEGHTTPRKDDTMDLRVAKLVRTAMPHHAPLAHGPLNIPPVGRTIRGGTTPRHGETTSTQTHARMRERLDYTSRPTRPIHTPAARLEPGATDIPPPPSTPELRTRAHVLVGEGGEMEMGGYAPQPPGILRGALAGVCVDNSTHCSCGLTRAQGEMCLYVINERAEPMICERRECGGRVLCACARGAGRLCRKETVSSVLVQVGGGGGVVLCRREETEEGVGVVVPVI